jgi:hypothetical protein
VKKRVCELPPPAAAGRPGRACLTWAVLEIGMAAVEWEKTAGLFRCLQRFLCKIFFVFFFCIVHTLDFSWKSQLKYICSPKSNYSVLEDRLA